MFYFDWEFILVQLLQLSAGQHLSGVDAKSPADRNCNVPVISGQYPYPHMELLQFLNRPGGAFLGRIKKCQIAQQNEVMLLLL